MKKTPNFQTKQENKNWARAIIQEGGKKLEIEKAKAKTKKHPGAEDILGILALCI